MRVLNRSVRPVAAMLAVSLGASILIAAGGCSGGAKADDGTNNPEAKRLTPQEFDSKRAKKGGGDQ